jgi:hypothetical protein
MSLWWHTILMLVTWEEEAGWSQVWG